MGYLEKLWVDAKKDFEKTTKQKKPDAKDGLFGHKADIAGQLKKLDEVVVAGKFAAANPLLVVLEKNIDAYHKVLDENIRKATESKHKAGLQTLKKELASILDESRNQVDDGIVANAGDLLGGKIVQELEQKTEEEVKRLRKARNLAIELLPKVYLGKDRDAAEIRLSSLQGDIDKAYGEFGLPRLKKQADAHLAAVTESLAQMLTDKSRAQTILARRSGSKMPALLADSEKLAREFKETSDQFYKIFKIIKQAEKGLHELTKWSRDAEDFTKVSTNKVNSIPNEIEFLKKKLSRIPDDFDIEGKRESIQNKIEDLIDDIKKILALSLKQAGNAKTLKDKAVPDPKEIAKAPDLNNQVAQFIKQTAQLESLATLCDKRQAELRAFSQAVDKRCDVLLKQRGAEIQQFMDRLPKLRTEWRDVKEALGRQPNAINISGSDIGAMFDGLGDMAAKYRDGKVEKKALVEQSALIRGLLRKNSLELGKKAENLELYEHEPNYEKVALAQAWIYDCDVRMRQMEKDL